MGLLAIWNIVGTIEKVPHLPESGIDQLARTFLYYLFLHTRVLPPTPTDGVARTFSLTPMPQSRIKLTSVQLQLSEGP